MTGGWEISACRIEIEAGSIAAVLPGGTPEGADLVVEDGWIIPGLIDLQVNGAGGMDLTSAEKPDLAVAEVARVLARHGVTAFCPTIITSPPDAILSRLGAYGPKSHPGGAESLGAHLEGPFLSPKRPGVHEPSHLRLADPREIEDWIDSVPPAIVTLAPELPGGLEAVDLLVRAGVLVSLGHSNADADDTLAALATGARMGTHIFNAMAPLHHRDPGLVGALLASDAMVSLIADGVHIDSLVVDLVVRAAGVERVALVSDALAAADVPSGAVSLGGQIVVSDGLSVRRQDGTLAGSSLLLDGCLRNAVRWLPWLAPAQVVRMATQTPVDALGGSVAARKGRIEAGCDADLAIMNYGWQVVGTVARGEMVYRDPAYL